MQPMPTTGQQAPQRNQDSGQPFPSSRAEAMQFSNDILQVLYDERTHDNIIKQLSSVGESDKTHSVGMIAANVVGDRVTDVKAQTGRSLDMGLVVGAVERVVGELSAMGKGNGFFEMSPEEEQASVQSSIQILDGITQGVS